MSDPRRRLPSVDALLTDPRVLAEHGHVPRGRLVEAVRRALAAARRSRMATVPDWPEEIRLQLHGELGDRVQRVINATGVVLHTNLGRAPLAGAALEAIASVAGGYASLELDLDSGTRGPRGEQVRRRLCDLVGSADALVINNAAAALLLAANTLAAGRRVAVSRGELIEIGGSFRIPDIVRQSGADILEIGSTNRTHLDDYAAALAAGVAAVLIVHRSNFEQSGYVATPDPAAVVGLARAHGVPVVHDIGSGLLVDLSPWGLTGEPRLPDAVSAGADLVIASGDKLMGGPQAGLACGTHELVSRMRRNPMARALRTDKLTLAALEATLMLYDDPDVARVQVPVLAMLTAAPDALRARAGRLAAACGPDLATELVEGESQVGGGAFPHASLPTTLVSVAPGRSGADAMALRLRLGTVPVIARVRDGRLLLDPRTIAEDDVPLLAGLVRSAIQPDE